MVKKSYAKTGIAEELSRDAKIANGNDVKNASDKHHIFPIKHLQGNFKNSKKSTTCPNPALHEEALNGTAENARDPLCNPKAPSNEKTAHKNKLVKKHHKPHKTSGINNANSSVNGRKQSSVDGDLNNNCRKNVHLKSDSKILVKTKKDGKSKSSADKSVRKPSSSKSASKPICGNKSVAPKKGKDKDLKMDKQSKRRKVCGSNSLGVKTKDYVVKNPRVLLMKDPLSLNQDDMNCVQKPVTLSSPKTFSPTKPAEIKLEPQNNNKVKDTNSLCNLFNTIWASGTKVKVEIAVSAPQEEKISKCYRTESDVSPPTQKLCPKKASGENTQSNKVPFPKFSAIESKGEEKCSKSAKIRPKITKNKVTNFTKKHAATANSQKVLLSQTVFSNHCISCHHLSNLQKLCQNRASQQKLTLIIYTTKFENGLRKILKRKYFAKKTRVRHKKLSVPVKTPSITDADDEDSDEWLEAPTPTYVISGPLKHISMPDLWIQKASYLRYLCNFYKLQSEGELPSLVSRLHWYVLHLNSSTEVARQYYLRYTKLPSRVSPTTSWVQKVLSAKPQSESES